MESFYSVSLFRFCYVDHADLTLSSACLCLLRCRIKGVGYHTQPAHPFLLRPTYSFRTSQGLKAHRCQAGQRQQTQGMKPELHKRCSSSSHPCTAADRSSEELGSGIFSVIRIILKNDIQNVLLNSFFPHSVLSPSF